MNINKTALILTLATALLSGCSSDSDETDMMEGTKGGTSDASASGMGGSGISGSSYGEGEDFGGGGAYDGSGDDSNPNAFMGPEFRDPANPLSKSTVYFMYDSSQVQPEFVPVVEAHARYLASHSSVRMTLAGHADERGSPEYNIALGEQRAKSVSRMMQSQGVSPAQLEVVSYGEEKPAVEGHDEHSWQLNRRAELLYQGQ